jgi:hypothetical protein
MIVRLLIFVAIMCGAVIFPTWLLALCAFFYALRYTAYELLILACAIDAFYGAGAIAIPYYTIFTALTLVIVEWLKPRFSLYNYEQ